MTIVRADFNDLDVDGRVVTDMRLSDQPLSPGDLVDVKDLFGSEVLRGRVKAVGVGGETRVVLDIDWDGDWNIAALQPPQVGFSITSRQVVIEAALDTSSEHAVRLPLAGAAA